MVKRVYQIILSINSLMMMLAVYGVKERWWLPGLDRYTIFLYIAFPIVLSRFCLGIAGYLSRDSIEEVSKVELANDSYIAVYLGYFFVALSIPTDDVMTLVFIFGMVFFFTFSSQVQYYNPLFLLLGYKFYYITREDNIKILIITKKDIRGTENLKFEELRRINDFTYIDEEQLE